MRKKFCIMFLIFICLSIIEFKFWTQKSAFYSKNSKEV